jgi:hypothetical protein
VNSKAAVTLFVIFLLVVSVSGCTQQRSQDGQNASNVDYKSKKDSGIFPQTKCTTNAMPDPKTDNITWTLPDCASPVRLSLPASIDDMFWDNNPSSPLTVYGYGIHAGEHTEGLNHIWIKLRHGTPVKSWADGVVDKIEMHNENPTEYSIRIDYGQNLGGLHGEISQPYVKVGQKVLRGQEIAMGMETDNGGNSAEFFLFDYGRNDGCLLFGASTVSPYDYLNDDDKSAFVAAYKKRVLEPLMEMENIELTEGVFYPSEPYLTNDIFLHGNNQKRLPGVWYSTSEWKIGFPPDKITFIEADNPYYRGNIVYALDDNDENTITGSSFYGTYEVDYSLSKIKITTIDGRVYYGIFQVNETVPRAKLKIEYKEGSYPDAFDGNALEYVQRSFLEVRSDAVALGVRNSVIE